MSQVRVIYSGKGKAQVLLPNGTDISSYLRNLEVTIDGGHCTARGAVFFADCLLGEPTKAELAPFGLKPSDFEKR